MKFSGDIIRWWCRLARGSELEHHLPGRVGLHALVGQSGSRDVAAQLLQRLAVVGTTTHGCAQAITVDISAHVLLEVRIPGHCALHVQYFLAGAWAEGDALLTGSGLQRPEHAGIVRMGVSVSHVGRTLLFDERPRRVSCFINRGPCIDPLYTTVLSGGAGIRWRTDKCVRRKVSIVSSSGARAMASLGSNSTSRL